MGSTTTIIRTINMILTTSTQKPVGNIGSRDALIVYDRALYPSFLD
jgi:hypothetical protein